MDTYVDTTIPYPDAKVAAALCVGGPIMYEFVQSFRLDDCWVNENVVPNIMKNHSCKRTSAVFGRAFLWACFDPLTKDHVPQDISDRVTAQYERIRTLEPAINPVKKLVLWLPVMKGSCSYIVCLILKQSLHQMMVMLPSLI